VEYWALVPFQNMQLVTIGRVVNADTAIFASGRDALPSPEKEGPKRELGAFDKLHNSRPSAGLRIFKRAALSKGIVTIRWPSADTVIQISPLGIGV